MRVALAQINTVVGDIDGNAGRVAAALADAGEAGADVTLVPELAISGYPPEDLLLRPAFAAACREALEGVAAGVRRGLAVIGFPEWDGDCHNSAAVVAEGRVQAVYRKRFLPNYGVFDEARYFRAGDGPMVLEALGARIGIAICEDIWYPSPVASDLAAARVDLICCISASPYHRGKGDRREQMLATRADDCAAALAFCNLVGGQDELVFDGRSALFDAAGELVARAPQFDERMLVADVDLGLSARRRLREPLARRLPAAAAGETLRIAASPAARNGAPLAADAGRDRPGPARRARGLGRPPHGPARLRGQEPLPGGARRPVGRDRLGPHGGPRRGRARRGPGDRRGDALVALLAREPGRRGGAGRVAGDPADGAADRRRWWARSRRSSPSPSPGGSPTSPRRTSRRGPAGRC